MANNTSGGAAENVEALRRRLRTIVRRYRVQAKLSQKEAARRLGFSETKLLRVEQGLLPIQVRDIRAMMQLYQETNPDVVESYVEQAILAQRDKGYEAYADIASRAYQELMGLEAAAEVIYKYEPDLVPGLLQTEEYARNLSLALGSDTATADRQVELRMLRQRKMGLEGGSHPELSFILGEAALATKVGNDEVMAEQIDHLLRLSAEDGINLALLPLQAGPHRSGGQAFTILQFADPELQDLLYLEGPRQESTSRDEQSEIKYYRELFLELLGKVEQFDSFEEQVGRIRRERYRRTEAAFND